MGMTAKMKVEKRLEKSIRIIHSRTPIDIPTTFAIAIEHFTRSTISTIAFLDAGSGAETGFGAAWCTLLWSDV